MQKLKELGIETKNASMCWVNPADNNNHILVVHNEFCYEHNFLKPIPTFTLEDILEMLPRTISHNNIMKWLYIEMTKKNCYFSYKDIDENTYIAFSNEEIFYGAYEMLIWLKENGYLK